MRGCGGEREALSLFSSWPLVSRRPSWEALKVFVGPLTNTAVLILCLRPKTDGNRGLSANAGRAKQQI